MKKLFLITAYIFTLTLTLTSVNAQTAPPSETAAAENKLYRNYPEPFTELTLIQFSIEEDSFARVYITDKLGNETAILTDGFVDKGDHYVYYKHPQTLGRGICKCKIEIYSPETNDVLFSDEIIMNYNDENKLVLRK